MNNPMPMTVQPGRQHGGIGTLWMPLLLGGGVAAIGLLVPRSMVGVSLIGILIALTMIYPILGVAGLLISAPVYLLISPWIPQGLPFSFLLLLLTLVGILVRRVVEPRRPPFRWHLIDVAAATLLVNGLLYVPLASTLKAGIYGYHENLRLFLIYFVIRLLNPGLESWKRVLWLTAIVIFGVTAYGIVQSFYGYEWVMEHYGITESLRDYAGFQKAGVRRAYSVLGSPLSLGMMGMIAVFAGLALLLAGRRLDRARLLAPLLLAAGVGASALSYTRSSWIGIGAGLLAGIVAVARGGTRLTLVLLPIAAAFVAFQLMPGLTEQIGKYALTIASQDPTETSFHYVALVEAARFFQGHLLGVGLGASSFSGLNYGTGIQMWTENTYFLIGIQMGIQGLAALLVFMVASARLGLRLYGRGDTERDRQLGALIFLAIAGFSVGGMAHPTLLDVSSMAPVWCLIGMAVNRRQELDLNASHPA